jgi:hypothetical protein
MPNFLSVFWFSQGVGRPNYYARYDEKFQPPSDDGYVKEDNENRHTYRRHFDPPLVYSLPNCKALKGALQNSSQPQTMGRRQDTW